MVNQSKIGAYDKDKYYAFGELFVSASTRPVHMPRDEFGRHGKAGMQSWKHGVPRP